MARCIGARCVLHRASAHVGVLHRRALHRSNTSRCMLHKHVASMRVVSVHRGAVHVASVHVACRTGVRRMLHGASARVACYIMLRCAWRLASGALHGASASVLRVASVLVARCFGARCMVAPATRSRPAAHGRPVRCVVSAARALLDWAKAGLLRWPSGGAMRSCAGLWRRALHGQGHRAVRRRGDIRHRSNGACESGRMRVGAGVGGRGAGLRACCVHASCRMLKILMFCGACCA
jgi:hypothetical protein